MDHLPLGKDASRPHVIVPYYNCNDFGFNFTSPWDSWPQRHKYDRGGELYYSELREGGYPDHLKPQLAAFVQSWLWFGLLCEFLNIPCCTEEWIVQHKFEAGEVHQPLTHRISTENLLRMLDSWYEETCQSSDEQRAETLRRVDQLLRSAESDIFTFVFSERRIQYPVKDISEPLTLSIAILHATLCYARNATFPHEPKLEGFSGFYDVLMDRMKFDNWCPVQTMRFYVDGDIITRYVASCAGPMKPLDHSQCEGYRCRASQVEHETYQTKHVSPDCGCAMSRNLSPEVVDILLQGDIPLIRVIENSTTVELEVKAVELLTSRDTEFVAISHVWSDGLGNLHQNSIPFCQLRRIQKQVDLAMQPYGVDLTSGVWFWMDTLCIPVGVGIEIARTAAIAKMVHVYRQSKLTLILNAELEKVSLDIEPWELSLHVNRAPWFNRLWTLHEGVISQRSVFQLEDRAIQVEDIGKQVSRCKSRIGRTIREILAFHFSRPYTAMAKFKNLPVLERASQIWSAVQWRNTSNQDDETICLANMLELDLSSILAIDRKDPEVCKKRMKAFILQQKHFPQDSPFCSINDADQDPLLTDPGYRWAPESFVFRSGNYEKAACPLGEADNQGLHVEMAALLPQSDWLSFLRLANHKSLLDAYEEEQIDKELKDPNMRIAFMVPFQWDYHYILMWDKSHVPHFDMELMKSTRPAILLEQDLPNDKLDTAEHFEVERHIEGFVFDEDPISDDDSEYGYEGAEVEGEQVEGDYKEPAMAPVSGSVRALLVAVLLDEQHVSSSKAPDVPASHIKNSNRVVPFAFVVLRKMMFTSSRREATYQLGDGIWPFEKHSKKKIGWFEALPKNTSWCIG